MKPLDGKKALVTGCKGRLGPIWIKALAAAGADVYGIDLPQDIFRQGLDQSLV